MGEKNDGGAVHPHQVRTGRMEPNGQPEIGLHTGMSLRDWFAGQAVAGLLSDPNVTSAPAEFAGAAYIIADAMLAARGDT
ncbi:MAG: hypothetical protein FD152_2053 [Xanthobacteraceae bacterium]|nr:MAG: hypothetical protein FD152_2053 [Xanthobacteraceae bacterium]